MKTKMKTTWAESLAGHEVLVDLSNGEVIARVSDNGMGCFYADYKRDPIRTFTTAEFAKAWINSRQKKK